MRISEIISWLKEYIILDSKGYFVPVYVFSTKINGQNNEIKIKAIK